MLLNKNAIVHSLTDNGWVQSTDNSEGKVLTALQIYTVLRMLYASCHPLAGINWRLTNS